jgi:hypothetical protein
MASGSGDFEAPFWVWVSRAGLICFKGRSVEGEVGGCLRFVVPFCSMGGGEGEDKGPRAV